MLTNVAYRRFKQGDFMKDSFVIDLISFLVQNSIQLTWKLSWKLKKNLIYYIYSFLYAKIYNRTNIFGIEQKNDFDFQFQM